MSSEYCLRRGIDNCKWKGILSLILYPGPKLGYHQSAIKFLSAASFRVVLNIFFSIFFFQDVKGPHAKLRVPIPKITEPLPPGKTCPVETSGAGMIISCASYFVVILSVVFPQLYFD